MESYSDSTRSARVNVSTALVASALLCLFCLSVAKWRRRRLYRLAAKLPGPPALPLIGNGLEFLGDPQDVMSKIIKLCSRYESPFRIWIGPILLVVISKPDDLQIVLNSSKTLEKDPLYRFFRNTVGTGLFSAPVCKWKRNRRVITPAFNNRLLQQFLPVFHRQNRLLVSKLSEAAPHRQLDLWHYVSAATLDIICQTALGVDIKAQDEPESDFAVALARASELDYMRIYKFWLHPDFIFNRVVYAKELKQIYNKLHGLPNDVIQRKKKEFQKKKEQNLISSQKEREETVDYKNEPKLKVFLDILLELKDEGNTFSDDDLRDEVITMMVGGSETSALTNCFCLLMLAIHPDIQNKVYEEVLSILGESDREVTIEDLSKMEYLEMVLKETLRRFPVGPLFLRQVTEDIELSEHRLPAGCSLVIAPIATHMNPSLYPEPQRFNPERFSPLAEPRHRYSFIPFSGGPRGCIGSKYAMLSMKTTISMILRHFRLRTSLRMEDIRLKVDLLMRSVDGFPVTLEPRN